MKVIRDFLRVKCLSIECSHLKASNFILNDWINGAKFFSKSSLPLSSSLVKRKKDISKF